MDTLKHAFKWLWNKRIADNTQSRVAVSAIYAIITWNMVIYVLYKSLKEHDLLNFESQKAKLLERHKDKDIYVINAKGFNITNKESMLADDE